MVTQLNSIGADNSRLVAVAVAVSRQGNRVKTNSMTSRGGKGSGKVRGRNSGRGGRGRRGKSTEATMVAPPFLPTTSMDEAYW